MQLFNFKIKSTREEEIPCYEDEEVKNPHRYALLVAGGLILLVGMLLPFTLVFKPPLTMPNNVPTATQSMKTCKQFTTQADAQAYFAQDKIAHKSLDGNHDGIACNSLLKKV